MSVIVRSSEEGIVLYSKGADSVMYGRLSEDTFNCHIVTQQLLNQYARRGLRTLCIAKKVRVNTCYMLYCIYDNSILYNISLYLLPSSN